MREKTLENKVCRLAQTQGWLVRKFSSPNHRAVPDRLLLRQGRILFIEFKALGQRPTKLQKREHEKYQAHGFKVHVIDTLEAGQRLLEAHHAP